MGAVDQGDLFLVGGSYNAQRPDVLLHYEMGGLLWKRPFAGVWARSTYDRGLLDPGDTEEGLQAAAAVGDDRLGARSREQWTHGSSELRVKWFRTGFDSGKASACDTSDVQL